jgi:hypothetical protein
MLASSTRVRGFEPCRSEKILSVLSFGGEVKPSVLVADLWHVKDTYIGAELAKLPVISRPQFPLSLLEVSRIVADVGAPGGASGNFQSIG